MQILALLIIFALYSPVSNSLIIVLKRTTSFLKWGPSYFFSAERLVKNLQVSNPLSAQVVIMVIVYCSDLCVPRGSGHDLRQFELRHI